jgi:hypothetical protein
MSDQRSSMSAPPPQPQNAQQNYAKMKQELEEAFKEFHQKHFLSKLLDENKSAAVKKTEQASVDRLVKAAVALDSINVGEGILALSVIAIREQLAIRDRVNELEYELCKVLRDVQNMKQELGIKDGEQKK